MLNYRKGSYIAGSFVSDSTEKIEDDLERFEVGLGAVRLLSNSHGWRTAWLIGETGKDLNFTEINRTFTPQQVTALRNKRPIALDTSTELRFATRATMHGVRARHALLVLRPTSKLLNQLDQYHEEHAVIVIPWSGDHIREWAETWGVVNLLPGGEQFQRPMIDDPVVREQLNDLVNVSHHGGLTYPTDLRMFREMFKRLKKEGHEFTVSAVRSFVIVESYRGVEVAEKIAKAAAPHAVKEETRPISDDD